MAGPSLTPNLQEALAVQQYMNDLIRQNVGGIPVLRAVRGTGAAAIDLGVEPISIAVNNQTAEKNGIPHQLGVVPTLILATIQGPAQFSTFFESNVHIIASSRVDFGIHVSSMGYSGGVQLFVGWLAIAMQF